MFWVENSLHHFRRATTGPSTPLGAKNAPNGAPSKINCENSVAPTGLTEPARTAFPGRRPPRRTCPGLFSTTPSGSPGAWPHFHSLWWVKCPSNTQEGSVFCLRTLGSPRLQRRAFRGYQGCGGLMRPPLVSFQAWRMSDRNSFASSPRRRRAGSLLERLRSQRSVCMASSRARKPHTRMP